MSAPDFAALTVTVIEAVNKAMDDFEGHKVLPYTRAQRSTVLNAVRAALAASPTPEPEYGPDGDPLLPDPHSEDWYNGYAEGQRDASPPDAGSWALMERLIAARIGICGMVSNSGPNGEPLACAYPANPPGEQMHEHSWATLPTFSTPDAAKLGLGPNGEEPGPG